MSDFRLVYIIKTSNPVTGYWTGTKWDTKKKAAMRYGTYAECEAVIADRFAWLRDELRKAIKIVPMAA